MKKIKALIATLSLLVLTTVVVPTTFAMEDGGDQGTSQPAPPQPTPTDYEIWLILLLLGLVR